MSSRYLVRGRELSSPLRPRLLGSAGLLIAATQLAYTVGQLTGQLRQETFRAKLNLGFAEIPPRADPSSH